jgi:hypothetical protein
VGSDGFNLVVFKWKFKWIENIGYSAGSVTFKTPPYLGIHILIGKGIDPFNGK